MVWQSISRGFGKFVLTINPDLVVHHVSVTSGGRELLSHAQRCLPNGVKIEASSFGTLGLANHVKLLLLKISTEYIDIRC